MLFQIAGLPVTFPLWTIHKVMEEAENEFYDERKILATLAELSQQHDQGEISEEEFTENKEILVDRLEEARARKEREEQETYGG